MTFAYERNLRVQLRSIAAINVLVAGGALYLGIHPAVMFPLPSLRWAMIIVSGIAALFFLFQAIAVLVVTADISLQDDCLMIDLWSRGRVVIRVPRDAMTSGRLTRYPIVVGKRESLPATPVKLFHAEGGNLLLVIAGIVFERQAIATFAVTDQHEDGGELISQLW